MRCSNAGDETCLILLAFLRHHENVCASYPGSNRHDILSLGSIFPFEVCRFLAFSSPPV